MTAHQQKRLILAVSIILLALIVLLIGWRHQRTVIAFLAQWQDYRQYVLDIRHLGPYAFLVFGLVMVVMTVIPGAPTSAVAMLVGVCLGHWGGFVVNAIGLTLGNLLQVQLLARVRDRRHKKPDSRVYRALVKMRHPAVGALIGYAVPMIPTAFVNLAAGDTHLTAKAQSLGLFSRFDDRCFYLRFCGGFINLETRLEESPHSVDDCGCNWLGGIRDSYAARCCGARDRLDSENEAFIAREVPASFNI
ncbi:TVP38/TMEM64 family protein [Latilactobacillus sakei]